MLLCARAPGDTNGAGRCGTPPNEVRAQRRWTHARAPSCAGSRTDALLFARALQSAARSLLVAGLLARWREWGYLALDTNSNTVCTKKVTPLWRRVRDGHCTGGCMEMEDGNGGSFREDHKYEDHKIISTK